MANEMLTPEEELELQELEAMDQQEVSQELSPEEESELVELEKLDSTSTEESLIRGAAQGITFGHADEISGAVESTLTDKSYEEARDESRAAFERARDAHTVAFFGGEAIGAMGTAMLSGPAGISLAGYRGAAIAGGLYGLGSSNKTGKDLAQDAALGAALGVGGEKVLRGIGGFVSRIGSKSSKNASAAMTNLSNSTAREAAELETNIVKTAFAHGKNSWDEILSTPQTREMSQTYTQEIPNMMGDIIGQAKRPFQSSYRSIERANANVKYDLLGSKELMSMVDEAGKTLPRKSDAKKWIDTFVEDLLEDNLGIGAIDTDGMTFKQLNKLKQYIADVRYKNQNPTLISGGKIAFVDKNGDKLLAQFENNLRNTLEQIDTTGTIGEINKSFGLLRQAEQLIPEGKSLDEVLQFYQIHGASKGVVKGSKLRDTLKIFDSREGTAYNQMLINETKPIADVYKLAQAAQDFDLGISGIFRFRAAESIAPGMGVLAIGRGGVVRLSEMAGRVSAKAATAFKLPRSMKGIVDNAPTIQKKLALREPAIALMFNEAYQSYVEGNTKELEQFVMQGLSNPAIAAEFEPGLGFDGKITSPEEAEQVKSQVMASGLPLRNKIEAVNQVEQRGIIPNVEAPPAIMSPEREQLRIKRKVSEQSLELVRKAEKEGF